ncbi:MULTISPECIES: hypothetical protein [unclassified Butyrivibrio]|uniref:hypothetical protein n=1 Tax=unclassified Butyrivibrio TaxID=2639466 RepID=UPI0003F8D64D|nr:MULTISPECIES: hypothetical protein [unclassified Butyrivibrio]SDB68531.1 hypothetical protein SAMN02910263_04225 [Butyrivibrio sp. INlla16]SEM04683.1 hypothetical protein SAMN04487770_12442 [Butyrivibrio sp. ob235]
MNFRDAYLKELLRRYEASFDITENFSLGDTDYAAYARFCSLSEKYVLKKEATLWSIKAFEHVLFIKEDALTEDTLNDIMSVITDYAEPELVRHGEKYPEKDHMCTYLTFVILTSKTPDKSLKKAIRKFRYDRGYLFNFRGHSEARLAVISMDDGEVSTNYSGRELKELLSDVYSKTHVICNNITEAATDLDYKSVS